MRHGYLVAVAIAATAVAPWCEGAGEGDAAAERLAGLLADIDGTEEPLSAATVQRAFDKVRTQQQPLSLADLGRQLRHACPAELDRPGTGGVADGATGRPPTRTPPHTEGCASYFRDVFPTAVELLNRGSLDLAPRLSVTDAAFLDARLAAAARFQLHMDVLAVPVQLLGHYLDHVTPGGDDVTPGGDADDSADTERQGGAAGGALWGHAAGAARPGAGGHWPRSLVPLLVTHVFSGGHHVRWEHEFTTARRNLAAEVLRAMQTGEDAPDDRVDAQLGLFAALACQAFLTDYGWWEDETDARMVAELRAHLAVARPPEDRSARLLISAYAAYRDVLPLVDTWPSFPAWNRACATEREHGGKAWPFWQLWRLSITEPRREHELAAALDDVTAADRAAAATHECALAGDGASCAVRRMYEQSPYPKWTRDPPAIRWPEHPLSWLAAVGYAPPAGWRPTITPQRPLKVMWVGCGTGYMLTVFARHFGPLVEIWAVDLSLASLGYAARRVDELGLTNVHFSRGDILALPDAITAAAPFDFMESSGVLHHLQNPTDALTTLVALLRPGAPVNLALYSALARRDTVLPCRAAGRRFNVSDDLSVREFRRELAGRATAQASQPRAEDRWVSEITRTEDYASLTGTIRLLGPMFTVLTAFELDVRAHG